MSFFDDRIKVAKLLFAIDAIYGIFAVAAATLYGAAMSSGRISSAAFLSTMLLLGVLWLACCYGAYRSCAGRSRLLGVVFWLNMLAIVFTFPVGTAIAVACIWVRRESRKQGAASAAQA